MAYVTLQPMLCRACQHEWRAEVLQAVVIDAWIAHVKSICCPACGAGWRTLSMKQESEERI